MEPKVKTQKIKTTSLAAYFSTIKTENYRTNPAANNPSPKTTYITCQLH